MAFDDKPFDVLSLSRITPLAVVCDHGGQHYHTTLTHDKVVHDSEAPRPICAKTKDHFPSVNHIHSKAVFKNQLWRAIDTQSADDDSVTAMAVFIFV